MHKQNTHSELVSLTGGDDSRVGAPGLEEGVPEAERAQQEARRGPGTHHRRYER